MAKKSAIKNPKPKAPSKHIETLSMHPALHNEREQATNSLPPSTEDRPQRPVIKISEAAIRNRLDFFAALENNDLLGSDKSNSK